MSKSRITMIGMIHDLPDGSVGVVGWGFEGGDEPSIDFANERVCGWTFDELRALVEAARRTELTAD